MRPTKLSVTVFLKHKNEFLFLHRNQQRKVDPNRLNGIGGKVEIGENYLEAAIRETKEETGYEISADKVTFAGFAHLFDGYPDDWLCAFFIAEVNSLTIPLGNHVSEGQLIWIPQRSVLQSSHELVDDLHYIWPFILEKKFPFFLAAKVDENEKISSFQLSSIG